MQFFKKILSRDSLKDSLVLRLLGSCLRDNPLTVARARALFCFIGIAGLYLGLGAGLSNVTIFAVSEGGQAERRVQQYDNSGARADIYDRNGEVLAKNLSLVSLVADPSELLDLDEAVQKTLAVFPDLDEARLRQLLSRESRYAMIKRGISPREQAAVNQAGIPGFYFEPSLRRIYPQGNLFSHAVGFIGTENQGLMGLERGFDKYIRGRDSGFVRLSLDARAQFILAEELDKQMRNYQAKSGSAIIMHAKSREILALVSLPDFDPHEPNKIATEAMFNHATQGLYEFGSTFKVFNSALSLEKGRSLTQDYYDATKPLTVGGGFRVTDFHAKNRPLNIAEIFVYSSNIGSALMAWDSGGHAQKQLFADLGLLQPINSEYPEVAKPQYPQQWSKIAVATLSYGHGISVSALHLTNAVTTIIGNGIHSRPHFTMQTDGQAETLTEVAHQADNNDGAPIISAATIARMRSLFRLNVLRGSGRLAHVPGYRIGGKTGTAEKIKADGSGYDSDKIIADFVAAFPMDDPQYVIFVMLDEPQPLGNIRPTGGAVAAPVAGKVIKRLAPILGVRADKQKEKLLDEKLYLPLLHAEDKPTDEAGEQEAKIINTAF